MMVAVVVVLVLVLCGGPATSYTLSETDFQEYAFSDTANLIHPRIMRPGTNNYYKNLRGCSILQVFESAGAE